MNLTCWEALAKDTSFEEIMTWCLEEHSVDRLLWVLRMDPVGNKWRYADFKAGEILKSQFGPYILTGFPAIEWPGTQGAQPAFVYVLNFNEEVKQVVLRTEPSLAKWHHLSQRSLPEDPCLFRQSDAHPIFVSVTHENLAWLLTDRTPKLHGFEKTTFEPQTFFPSGKYFCRKYQKPRRR